MLSERRDEDAATAFFICISFLRVSFCSNGWRITDNPTIERSMININPRFMRFSFMSGTAFRIATLKRSWKKDRRATARLMIDLFHYKLLLDIHDSTTNYI
jgi:hypothetical protein